MSKESGEALSQEDLKEHLIYLITINTSSIMLPKPSIKTICLSSLLAKDLCINFFIIKKKDKDNE